LSANEEILEEILSSRGRIRILIILAKSQTPLTIYKISKLTGLSTKNTRKNIEILIKHKWIKEIKINRATYYKINEDDEIAKEFLKFIKRVI